ncbi:hypothetical protein NQ318_006232 [Aromia moschata]|uniref:Uncharacterized protein n=1 Tax=Aromia moschata TaxID=1265417 RepID=A0AAV8XV70_9CUCU|nr:hypothetical protein NQ318_006232 [Aromia moschata]
MVTSIAYRLLFSSDLASCRSVDPYLHGTEYNVADSGNINPSGFKNLSLAIMTDSSMASCNILNPLNLRDFPKKGDLKLVEEELPPIKNGVCKKNQIRKN